jgi:hypothetical protein
MFGLNVMDTANALVLIWKLPEPRTAFNVIMGYRTDPDVIYEAVSNLNR